MSVVVDPHDCGIEIVENTDDNEYTLEYVKNCNNDEKFWVYSRGTIYDITHFRKNHPGGGHVFANKGGKDITAELNYHTKRTRDSLFMYEVGKLKDEKKETTGCSIM